MTRVFFQGAIAAAILLAGPGGAVVAQSPQARQAQPPQPAPPGPGGSAIGQVVGPSQRVPHPTTVGDPEALVRAMAVLQSADSSDAARQEARKIVGDQLRMHFDADLANRREQIAELEQQIARLREQLVKRESSEPAKQQAPQGVGDQLRLEIAADLATRREQIAKLEQQIARLRSQLVKHEKARERLVELRLMRLENEAAGLGGSKQGGRLPGLGRGGGKRMPGQPLGREMVPGGTEALLGSGMDPEMPAMGGSASAAPPPSLRAVAATAKSRENLQRIGLALTMYHDSHVAFPAAFNVDAAGKGLLSWRVHVLPFLGHNPLYKRFRLDESWDSEHNRQLIDQMPAVYRSSDSKAEAGRTRYLGNATAEGIFVAPRGDENGPLDARFPRGTRSRDILDGASNTIMVVEANEAAAVIWTKPDDLAFDAREDPWQKLLEPGHNAFLAVLCDGSVQVCGDSLDRSVLDALFTHRGGEVIPVPP